MDLIVLAAILIVSLIIAIKSAGIFIDNLVDIGSSLGISQIILGVTASAIGSSLLEFGSAMTAILTGNPEVGVGCILGANIWNITGILGISAIFAGTMTTSSEEITRDGPMALITAIIFMIFIYFTGKINIIISAVMVTIYLFYIWLLIKVQKKEAIDNQNEKTGSLNLKSVLWIILGVIGLMIGCRALVYSSVEIANLMNISGMIVGIFILALGTTVPEFVVTVTSAVKGLHHLAFGTILGSNVFNILIGVGIPAIFTDIHMEKIAINFDAPALVLITILLLILMQRGMKLTRYGGLILLFSYLIYIGTRLYIIV